MPRSKDEGEDVDGDVGAEDDLDDVISDNDMEEEADEVGSGSDVDDDDLDLDLDDLDIDEAGDMAGYDDDPSLGTGPNYGDEDAIPLHPYLTKYEIARILGVRETQLAHGAPTPIAVPPGMENNHAAIAREELRQGLSPFAIARPLPNGSVKVLRASQAIVKL